MPSERELSEQAEILETEKKRIGAFIRFDRRILDEILTDDFYYINSRGSIITEEQLISALQNGEVLFESIDLEDPRVRIFGDAAVLTGKIREVGASGNDRFDEWFRFTRLFVRRSGGRWRSVAYHSSKIAFD